MVPATLSIWEFDGSKCLAHPLPGIEEEIHVTAVELRATQLTVALRGYAPAEVDEALSVAVQELEQRGTSPLCPDGGKHSRSVTKS